MIDRAEEDKERGNLRSDFIKRLFAVAISVGFASALISMNWITTGSWPSEKEWQQVAMLCVGLVATILSWDGYLLSIRTKPLLDYPRFLIDILLVFIYLFLLLSAKQPVFFSPTLALIFTLYLVWDILTIRLYYSQYTAVAAAKPAASLKEVLIVYLASFRSTPGTSGGPAVTVFWWLYFLSLAFIGRSSTSARDVYITCILTATGLAFFRYDKSQAKFHKFNALMRAALIVILLASAFWYFRF